MLSEQEKLDALIRLGTELNQVNDLDLLLEHLLTVARKFVNADAGTVYIRRGDQFFFFLLQNDTMEGKSNDNKIKLPGAIFRKPVREDSIAGYVAKTGEFLNLVDVHYLPDDAPYTFNVQYDRESGYRTGSMLTIPLKNKRGVPLGILQIINAQDPDGNIVCFTENDERMMFHFASIAAIALERAQMTRALLLRMIRMAELRDPKETGAHVNRVGSFSVALYQEWAERHNIPEDEIVRWRDILRMAAMLHDAGKVGITDTILKKPGRLTDEERAVMNQHCLFGSQLFRDLQSDFDEIASQVALNHHENWDGTGYPGHIDGITGEPLPGFENPDGTARGKIGEETPLFGRIVKLADVFDALSSQRCYKPAWDEDKVLRIIQEESGTSFDPELVEIFMENLDTMRQIQQRYAEEKQEME